MVLDETDLCGRVVVRSVTVVCDSRSLFCKALAEEGSFASAALTAVGISEARCAGQKEVMRAAVQHARNEGPVWHSP